MSITPTTPAWPKGYKTEDYIRVIREGVRGLHVRLGELKQLEGALRQAIDGLSLLDARLTVIEEKLDRSVALRSAKIEEAPPKSTTLGAALRAVFEERLGVTCSATDELVFDGIYMKLLQEQGGATAATTARFVEVLDRYALAPLGQRNNTAESFRRFIEEP